MNSMPAQRTGWILAVSLFALLGSGCDVQKIGNRMSAGDDAHGSGSAQGGLSYTATASGKEWSQTFSSCHGSTTDAGITTARAGTGSGDFPLTVVADKTVVQSVTLKAPQGTVVFAPADCSTLTLNRAAADGLKDAGGTITGKVAFQCAKDGKSVTGAVVFNQCPH